MQKILFTMTACGVAAAIAWALVEPFSPGLGEAFARWQVFYSLMIGGAIGGTLGGISGYVQGSRVHFYRSLLLGLVLGALGGYMGLHYGGAIANALFPGVLARQDQPSIVFARTLVFIPFGAFIGITYGLGSRSLPRILQGALGGAIGGAVAGASFDAIGRSLSGLTLALQGQMAGEVGQIPRAVASVLIGASIGLFAGIVEAATKRAWVRLELARNEGKEWIVDAPRTFIGRSENAHIPLYGDPNVLPMHACISREHGYYKLLDGGSPIGIGINGIRVPEAILSHGDVINVGSFQLRFYLRNPQHNVPARDAVKPSSPPQAAPLPTSPKVFSLVALDGPLVGKRYQIGQIESIAGREGDWINLSFDAAASRRHAAFTSSAVGAHVRDLGSTNGTIVNGARVQEMMLREGDTVQIGTTTFRLES